MKKFLFAITFIFILLPGLFAQQGNFGILNYTVPAGYELIKNENVLTYVRENKTTGTYCNIFIYKLMPGHGGLQQDFDFAWTNLVQNPFKVTGSASLLPRANLKGWEFLLGNTMYNDNGIATLAMLISFSGEGNMQNICILSNADSYKADIESFMASVDVARETGTPATVQQTESPNSPAKKESVLSHPNYELWMSSQTNSSTLQLQYRYVVLASDGSCLFHLPGHGLYNLTKEDQDEKDSWGKVTDKGDRLLLNHERLGKMELFKKSSTALAPYINSKPFNYYKKCVSVNGLKLEGAYSPQVEYYKKTSNILSKNSDPNKRPIIFFKKDGTCINEGIEFSNFTKGDDFAIGKGSYEIKDFSLILTTQSGRKLQVAFAGILDANPQKSTEGYIVNQLVFYKLDKSFWPHE